MQIFLLASYLVLSKRSLVNPTSNLKTVILKVNFTWKSNK